MPIMKPTNWKMAAVTTLAVAELFGSSCRREPIPQPLQPKPQIEYIHTIPLTAERFSQKELNQARPVSYNVLARHLRSADVLLFPDIHNVPERAEAMGRIMPLLKRMGFPNMVMGDLWAELQPVLDEFGKTGRRTYELANSIFWMEEFQREQRSIRERSSRGAIWGVLRSAQGAKLRIFSPSRMITPQEKKTWIHSHRKYTSDVDSLVAARVLSIYRGSAHGKSVVFVGQAHIEGIRKLLEEKGLHVKVVRLSTKWDDYNLRDNVRASDTAETMEQIIYNGCEGYLDSLAKGLELDPKFGKLVFWPVPARLTERPIDAVIYNPSLNWDLKGYLQELQTACGWHGE